MKGRRFFTWDWTWGRGKGKLPGDEKVELGRIRQLLPGDGKWCWEKGVAVTR